MPRAPSRRRAATGRGRRGARSAARRASCLFGGEVRRGGRDRGRGVGRGDRLWRGRFGRRDDALGRVVRVELRLRLEVADLSGRRVDEPERRGRLLDALAAREARVVVAEAVVLALELRRLLRHLGDLAVHLEQVDVEKDDAGEQNADQPDPDPAGEEGVEDARAAGKRPRRRSRAGAGRDPARRGSGARRFGVASGGPAGRGRLPAGRIGLPARRRRPGRRRAAHQAASPAPSLRAARRRPDFARGLLATSPGVGATARPVSSSASGSLPHTHTGKSGGQTHPRALFARKRLTRRSSSEWKAIAARRPPSLSRLQASGSARSSESSSPFTAIRTAWKTRLAGWPPPKLRRTAAGSAASIASTSSPVVSIGARRLRLTISRAIPRAFGSSPTRRKTCASWRSSHSFTMARASSSWAGSMRMSSGAS